VNTNPSRGLPSTNPTTSINTLPYAASPYYGQYPGDSTLVEQEVERRRG